MYAEERRRQIASLTAVEGRVNVTELAEKFGVTAETIRRDLAVLNDEGIVHRVHGGAVASQSFLTTEFPLEARYRAASTAKMAIARAALQFLPDRPDRSLFRGFGKCAATGWNRSCDHPSGRRRHRASLHRHSARRRRLHWHQRIDH